MKTLNVLKGMPVVAEENGEILGHIEEVVINWQEKRIEGFLVAQKGWHVKNRTWVPYEWVGCIGKVTVVLKKFSPHHDKKKWTGKKFEDYALTIRNSEGVHLGWLHDIIVDEETGQISALEMSTGIFDDLKIGRKRFHHFVRAEMGDEIIVPPQSKAQ